MSNSNQPSTLGSYVNSAIGTIQSTAGSLLGSNGDRAEGEVKKAKAQAEHDASHTSIKVPGFSASSSGAVSKDDPDRTAGSWNQTMGAAKEFAGGLVGSESLKQAGREQNRSGQTQELRGQASDLVEGVTNRTVGAIGGTISSLTGDSRSESQYQEQHDKGKSQQRGVEHDVQKRAQAQQ